MSDSLRPHGLQHARPPCPTLSPVVCSNSCPLSWWCHPTISSSVVPFSSCPQSFPASGSFPVSRLFAWGGQRIGASASASVLPMNIQGLISFRTDWFDLHAVQGTLKSLLQHHNSKASILMVQLSHPNMTTGKTITLFIGAFVSKVMSPFFNMLSRFVIAFLPRIKRLLILLLQLPSAWNMKYFQQWEKKVSMYKCAKFSTKSCWEKNARSKQSRTIYGKQYILKTIHRDTQYHISMGS